MKKIIIFALASLLIFSGFAQTTTKKKRKSRTKTKTTTTVKSKKKLKKVSDKKEIKVAEAKPAAPVAPVIPPNKPYITFEQPTRDFGDIVQGEKVSHTFKFQNAGTQPLIISNVQTTCGCTVPEWPKEPIPPGNTGLISATFNSANKSGIQQKVITIYSNAANDQATVKILANVLPPKKTEMPANGTAPTVVSPTE
ncbi:Protein of unknown function [Flexibacter flexilis DSM 6793]|uniref:DUF1573 domain-containing protein n=1 Tax=Flexibacter flexilis DSM 6793 TaxID=927664 RepID=A0A1I1EEA1_9BACT|nr:DUF1573 domain-containing protein [Flexibacter flexilis]SFB85484.1 Protein of unknown function [Flexibacter flexilis DSM 6793]